MSNVDGDTSSDEISSSDSSSFAAAAITLTKPNSSERQTRITNTAGCHSSRPILKKVIFNHRLAPSTSKEEDCYFDQKIEDLFPLILDQEDDLDEEIDFFNSKTFSSFVHRKNPQFWLICKTYFAITFLMFALFCLSLMFLNRLVLANLDPTTNLTTKNNPTSWSNRNGDSTRKSFLNQTFEINLDSRDRYRLLWTVDYDFETVLFELRLNLDKPYDWFVFGFSERGEIFDADLCVLWFERRKKKLHFENVKSDDESFVMFDPNRSSNDCRLVWLKRHSIGGSIRLAFRRYFDTCHSNDYIIDEGTTHLVWATGPGPMTRIEGLKLSDHPHGYQRAQLLKSVDQRGESNQEEQSHIKQFEILNPNIEVPGVETTYWCHLVRLPPVLGQKKAHIVQYEAVIQKENTDLVHHMELFHCETDPNLELPPWNGSCTDPAMPTVLKACKRVTAAWAFGAKPMVYPENVGLPVGGKNYSLYVMLEVHYNNPELKSDAKDSSGIRIHYTEQLRPIDAGILEVGLEYTDKNSIPPQVVVDLHGYCVAECTRAGLPPDGITIFASQLHTHLTGIGVWTKHVRGGVELPEINRDNHYSPHFQEIRQLKRPVRVYPGDAIINVCRYDTKHRRQITLGGFGITDEMCVNYMHYYPKINLEVCKSSIDTDHLIRYFDFLHRYEDQNTSSRFTVAENYRNIKWSLHQSRQLDYLYRTAPLSMQCNQSSGERFPGYWNGIPLTRIVESANHHSNGSSRCRWVRQKEDSGYQSFSDDDKEIEAEDEEIENQEINGQIFAPSEDQNPRMSKKRKNGYHHPQHPHYETMDISDSDY